MKIASPSDYLAVKAAVIGHPNYPGQADIYETDYGYRVESKDPRFWLDVFNNGTVNGLNPDDVETIGSVRLHAMHYGDEENQRCSNALILAQSLKPYFDGEGVDMKLTPIKP